MHTLKHLHHITSTAMLVLAVTGICCVGEVGTMESAESAPSTKAQKKPRVHWTEKATWALVKLWEDNLDALRGQKHNGVVHQTIAERLTDAGIPRTHARSTDTYTASASAQQDQQFDTDIQV